MYICKKIGMRIIRCIRIFNGVVNSLGSLVVWWYVFRVLELGVRYLEGIIK